MKKQNKEGVFYALKTAARSHRLLTAGTLLCVAGSVTASLLPPLLLARMIDSLTGGVALTFTAVLLYFESLVLEGVFSSAQETLLVIFGQKMTHALRAEMSQKLMLPLRGHRRKRYVKYWSASPVMMQFGSCRRKKQTQRLWQGSLKRYDLIWNTGQHLWKQAC